MIRRVNKADLTRPASSERKEYVLGDAKGRPVRPGSASDVRASTPGTFEFQWVADPTAPVASCERSATDEITAKTPLTRARDETRKTKPARKGEFQASSAVSHIAASDFARTDRFCSRRKRSQTTDCSATAKTFLDHRQHRDHAEGHPRAQKRSWGNVARGNGIHEVTP